MDRLLRTYAHTAWTAADPLANLAPEVRRAILLMPSTFRERWKLKPWTHELKRREVMREILAERRLAYELANGYEPLKAPEAPAREVVAEPKAAEPLSPYYQYRMLLNDGAYAGVVAQRRDQDAVDAHQRPEAAENVRYRQAVRSTWQAIQSPTARQRLLSAEQERVMDASRRPPRKRTMDRSR